jgi:DnaK suppressor protein
MALSKERLESFKRELEKRREGIVRGLHATNAEMINDDPFHADTVDQASMDADKTLALQIKNRDAIILTQIEEALRRADMGGFGECESCGEDISLARMKANPSSTLCVDCQAELENEQGRFSRQA